MRSHSCALQLVPAGFNILPLPSEIFCFLIRVLQTLESLVLDSKQEPVHDKKDRAWRRWTSFCAEAGFNSDSFLSQLQQR